ncbi:hypothetical protein BT93_D1474 [Corymbia citriodora subsp. variegata]|nr:hypothetical protein BT93_D1474 [Corymbia citriodora subsp. variegata]
MPLTTTLKFKFWKSLLRALIQPPLCSNLRRGLMVQQHSSHHSKNNCYSFKHHCTTTIASLECGFINSKKQNIVVKVKRND